ncbi:U4/U6 small nuclear ribonucleoprotein Prp3 [Cucumis melo var. makuwa]|uniref:U4/U6 small nuclear ribonucleoprotein Prp3 n=1 Tax=Cucumis melo var. makuwa TaxID=1194695 RepID=A0A5D3CZW3_CUCMM|nr:U4/U6 small nuclear ribonucleoprotein Prp3 [Cucumis melo var. makuwa]
MTAITRANQCKVESVMETNSPKRKLRSSSVQRQQSPVSTPSDGKAVNGGFSNSLTSPIRCLLKDLIVKPDWNPKGPLLGSMVEPTDIPSASVPQNLLHPSHSLPIKVSSISTTNENKGVSITRSHEVHGKSSTDGTSSTAGKSGNLSLDALTKAKKALQMQKELAEKLKKISLEKALQEENRQLANKENEKALVERG